MIAGSGIPETVRTAEIIANTLQSLGIERWPTAPVFEPISPPKVSAPRGKLILNDRTRYAHTGDQLVPLLVLPSPESLNDPPHMQSPVAYSVEFVAGRESNTRAVFIPTPAGAQVPAKVHDQNPGISRDVGRTVGTDNPHFLERVAGLRLGEPDGAAAKRILRTSAILPGVLHVELVGSINDTSPIEEWLAYPILEANGPARFDGFHKGHRTTFEIPLVAPDQNALAHIMRVPIAAESLPGNPYVRNRRQAVECFAIREAAVHLDPPIIWFEQLGTDDYPRISYRVHYGLPEENFLRDGCVLAAVAVFGTISDKNLALLLSRLTQEPGRAGEIQALLDRHRKDTERSAPSAIPTSADDN